MDKGTSYPRMLTGMCHPNNNMVQNAEQQRRKKIQTIMNNIIKRILQEPQSPPNDAITIGTGILNIQTLTEIKQLNTHMRINKMDQN